MASPDADSRRPFHELALSRTVGVGPDAFAVAREAVLTLRMQRRAGLRMTADHSPVQLGDIVTIKLGPGPLAIRGRCEVIEVIDEERRAGFRYQTLPDHVEDGVELFLVEWAADDSVLVGVESRSRANSPLTRYTGPVGRLAQRVINQRYLAAAAKIVAESGPGQSA